MRKLEYASLVACLMAIVVLAASTLWFRELSVFYESNFEAKNEQNQNLIDQLNSLRNEIDNLEDDNAILQSKNENLESENVRLRNDVDTLESKVGTLEIQLDATYDVGYDAGYLQGFNETGYNIRDPTYQEVVTFIALDQTDKNEYDEDNYYCFHFTADVERNAFEAGYRCGLVYIECALSAHAVVCFNTTDGGLIFVEPQTDEIVEVVIGEFYDTDEFWVGTIQSYAIVW